MVQYVEWYLYPKATHVKPSRTSNCTRSPTTCKKEKTSLRDRFAAKPFIIQKHPKECEKSSAATPLQKNTTNKKDVPRNVK